MIRLLRGLPFAMLLALGACSQSSADTASQAAASNAAIATHPESGLKVIAVTVSTRSGKQIIRAELAESREHQARGLMFRTAMGDDEGMLFPFESPRMASFWMRNTVIPLDIIFIGTDRRVLNVAANTVPYDESPVRSQGIAAAVLELNAGQAAKLGIAAGDKVSW